MSDFNHTDFETANEHSDSSSESSLTTSTPVISTQAMIEEEQREFEETHTPRTRLALAEDAIKALTTLLDLAREEGCGCGAPIKRLENCGAQTDPLILEYSYSNQP